MEICRNRIRDSEGKPHDEHALNFYFAYSLMTHRREEPLVNCPRILIGCDVTADRFCAPENIVLRPESIKGMVSYRKTDETNYLLGNLGVSEDFEHRKMATYLMWAALQSIQDECIIGNCPFVTINLESGIGEEFYQSFGFKTQSMVGTTHAMQTKLSKNEILNPCWTYRDKPKPPAPHAFIFPDCIYTPAAALNAA